MKQRVFRLASLAALIWIFHAPGAWAQEPTASFAVDTRAYLKKLEKLGFAGVVLVARDGERLVAEGYGLADRERGLPWGPGTVSTIGSITKQFTAAAILLLEQEGQLSVGDSISRYFEDVPADKRSITLHQLLTHSSGIVDLKGLGDWDPVGRDEFVQRVMAQPLEFPPGESYAYSNAGYSLLGVVIEQLTGVPYERFLRDRLFLPHGMYETGYVLPRWGEGRLAQGYAMGGKRWGTVLERPLGEDGPYWVLRANGGIHSTAYDMLRWARALTAGRVLSPESMAKYWAPHVSEGGDSYYGYGWVITTVPPDVKVVTHNGGNGIFFADMAIIPDAGIVLFLQTNVVADAPLAEALLEQFGRRLLTGEPYPAVPVVVEVEAATLLPLAGEYRLAGGVLRFTVDGTTLLLEAEGQEAFARPHSTRSVDVDRAERLSARIDDIVTAYLAGDFGPVHHAYGGRASIERLRSGWQETLRAWEEEHGALRGHEILGSAMRPERDVTVVRFLFEHGHEDRAYVWDEAAEERLLGYSRRGLDAQLRFFPVAGGAYASWDRMTGSSKPLRIERHKDGSLGITLGVGEDAVRGRRR
jgi:CubicO group peptidase (beta-lactamase class C family)